MPYLFDSIMIRAKSRTTGIWFKSNCVCHTCRKSIILAYLEIIKQVPDCSAMSGATETEQCQSGVKYDWNGQMWHFGVFRFVLKTTYFICRSVAKWDIVSVRSEQKLRYFQPKILWIISEIFCPSRTAGIPSAKNTYFTVFLCQSKIYTATSAQWSSEISTLQT